MQKYSILIFTDLDGTLLHRDTFKFDEIKDYIKDLLSKGIYIIPNSSKTDNEILEFNKELGIELPFISENGSAINGLNLINKNFPNNIILSREKNELLEIFHSKIQNSLKEKCEFILIFAGVFEHRLFLVVLFVLSVSLSISSSFLIDFMRFSSNLVAFCDQKSIKNRCKILH